MASPAPVPAEVLNHLVRHWRTILLSTGAVTVLAVAFAWLRPPTWLATQALIVRAEATTSAERVGKFRDSDDMKTVQETILELATSRAVLERAWCEAGSAGADSSPAAPPSEQELDDLRCAVAVKPPKGAEFGKTEMFYLTVKDRDRQRAVDLAAAIGRSLQRRYADLLEAKAQGMIQELERAVAGAEGELAAAACRLGALERSVGPDLAELRILNDSPNGTSDLRQRLVTLEAEQRQAKNDKRQGEELLALLQAAQADPQKLLATPGRLLEAQPGLKRLKEGLVDAQLRSSTLLGGLTAAHPRAEAALRSEREVRENLHRELAVAIEGAQAELRLATARLAGLDQQLDETRQRLERLAALRADYATLAAANTDGLQLVEKARRDLSEARSSQIAARSASLLTLVDRPETGPRPAGPGRAAIALAGLAGGLACGVGLALVAAPVPLTGRGRSAAPTKNAANGQTAGRSVSDSPAGLSLKQALRKVGPSSWN
jgi:uncharacterized protein involved in exopolysaccharide biosynthesis